MANANPWTAATLTSFWTNVPQMGLSNDVRQRLATEGLSLIDHFADFKEDEIDEAVKNLRIRIDGIPAVNDANGNVLQAAVPPVNPVIVSALCVKKLKVASVAYHYYVQVQRTPIPSNMNYNLVLRGFYIEWEALTKLANEDRPEVPVLSKSQTVIRWMESFRDCLSRTFGVRNCPILYVIRDTVAVPPEADDPLAAGKAYGSSGSLVDEMMRRLSHNDPLYKSDNSLVFSLLDEATRGTVYAPTIKPYARTKDGRQAWLIIISSHAGQDKWEAIMKEKLSFLMNTLWKGNSYSLEKFCSLHRTAYVMLEEAKTHVDFQLPTEHTRVGYLLDNIQHTDGALVAALAQIRLNNNGMRSNFELAVAYLLPVCPYAKSRRGKDKKNPHAQISETVLKGKSQSKTGVDFRWYKPEEWRQLTIPQRKELHAWQNSRKGRKITAQQKSKADAEASAVAGVTPPAHTTTNNKNMTKKQLLAKLSALESKPSELSVPSVESLSAAIAAAIPTIPPAPAQAPITASAATLVASATAGQKRKATFDHNTNIRAAALSVQQILKRGSKKDDE